MVADRIGETLGNYTLVRLLGQGSFAEVYLGEHRYLERSAAIKVLHVRMEGSQQEAFRREARTIAQLRHPHIIGVHDFGIEEQTPYLVMEYTPNGTLRSCHPKGTCLPFEQIVIYVKQIASALDYAHAQHVIHRDIKPENILLGASQEVVLSDFGIAVVQRTLDSLSTQELAGTPFYMAPEQIQRQACAASDQYALGVMVYEWICGEPPFRGSLYEVFSHHLHEPPPSLRTRLPELPVAVDDAVMGALAKDPQYRFPTVQDFATVLEEACFATQPLSLHVLVDLGKQGEITRPLVRVTPLPASFPTLSVHPSDDESTQPRLGRVSRSEREQAQGASVLPLPVVHRQTVAKQAKLSHEQKNRQRLLRRVHSFWIEGVLDHSLHGAALLALGLQTQPDAVANPWHLVLQHPETTPTPLPAGTRITQVYDEADGELLILGAPGSGKTTLLLELARDLLARAEHDESHPMPVIFNLSSWATKQQSLVDWLAEELNTKYQVPSKLAQALLSADQILSLLDGLDEVAPTARSACIEAINTYRREHGLLPLVVCSRQADYLAQSGRLLVRSAVTVQPLTQEQVDVYLAQGGEPLWALRLALHQDAALCELASTPLLLSILTLTYHGKPVEELLRETSMEERQRWVFEQYVGHMLTRRGPLKAGTSQQVVRWLTFLATRMRERNQTVFYLEQMQPDWLALVQYRSYEWLAVRLPAILVGILAGLVVLLALPFSGPTSLPSIVALGGFLGWISSRPTSAPERAIDDRLQGYRYRLGRALPLSIIVGLIVRLSFGLNLYGPEDWLYDGSIWGLMMGISSLLLSLLLPSRSCKHASASKTNQTIPLWKNLVHLVQTVHGKRALFVIAILGTSYGVSYGLSIDLSYGLINVLKDGLSSGLDSGLKFGLISVLVSLILEAQAEGIFLTEHLRWTRKSLMRSLLTPKHVRTAFLIASVISITAWLSSLNSPSLVTLIEVPQFRLVTGLSTGLLYWLLLGLFQGVSNEQIEDRARRVPNQGIRRSLHNSMLMTLISGGIIAVVGMLSYLLSFWLGFEWLIIGAESSGLQIVGLNSWLSIELFKGLFIGLFIGVCGGLLVGSISGGLATLRHGILRLLLQRAGVIPRHYVHFLDEVASCILLQKVGGGYSFVHRLLLDYFAELEKKDP